MVYRGYTWGDLGVGYTTIKVSKQVKERLDRYARVRGLTLAGAVDRLLSEEEVREELEEIKQLLKEQNEILMSP